MKKNLFVASFVLSVALLILLVVIFCEESPYCEGLYIYEGILTSCHAIPIKGGLFGGNIGGTGNMVWELKFQDGVIYVVLNQPMGGFQIGQKYEIIKKFNGFRARTK